ILEARLRAQLAEDLAGDANRRPSIDVVHHREHLEWIAARSDWLRVFAGRVAHQAGDLRRRFRLPHPRRPAVEILAVPERLPAAPPLYREDSEERRNEKSGCHVSHFFTGACQFNTTVIGAEFSSSALMFTRKRWPSRVATY